ncbi:MAG: type IV toxin-antitoxin system AbiEi family antitoxin domain-containing protein [Simkaniaceae bacterium]|nr:type IV toxin-antitoxin system AbiEi family antitoxin domain-containing protein [Candidatus Sacchlamyda saccharinae]
MRRPDALEKLAPLLEKPYFTAKDAREVGVHPATLSYYVKTKKLNRIHRGVYQSVSYRNPKMFRWADLIEAIHSVKGGVICLISALAIYDLTEEIPRQHWIAIRHGTSIKKTKDLKIIRYRDVQLGRREIELEGAIIPIFDRERTIIDAFRLLSREIAIKALKSALKVGGKNKIDLIKLQEYAKKLYFDITPYLMSVTI